MFLRKKKNDGHMFLCLTLVLLKCKMVDCQDLLDIFPYLDPFHDSSKAWAKYHEAFLANTLLKYDLANLNLPNLVHLEMSDASDFCLASCSRSSVQKRVRIICDSYHQHKRKSKTKELFRKLREPFYILEPTGQIQIEKIFFECPQITLVQNEMPGNSILKTLLIQWSIWLDVEIALKIIFTELHICFGYLGNCHPKQVFKVESVLPTQIRSKTFLYCGFNPSFALYPPSQKINFALACHKERQIPWKCPTSFHVNFSFTSIDNRIVYSHPTAAEGPQLHQERQKLFVKDRKAVVFYQLIAQKKHKLWIKLLLSAGIQYKMFDGPGIISELANSALDEFNTTTFQASLILFLPHLSNMSVKINYQLINTVSSTINLTTHIHHQYFFSSSRSTVCPVLLFQTPENFRVNLTITELNFTGVTTNNCTFGGMAIFDMDEEQMVSCSHPVDENNSQKEHLLFRDCSVNDFVLVPRTQ